MKGGFFRENIWLKIASLILAIVLWFFVVSGGRSVVIMDVPIKFKNIPEGLEIVDTPKTVSIGIEGQERLLKELKKEDVSVIIDLSRMKEGKTLFSLSQKDVKLPKSLLITSISPKTITLILEGRLKKQVPVKPVIVGLLTEGFTVEAIKTMPEMVTIEGPKSVVTRIYMVKTEPIDVTGINRNIRYSVPLSLTNPDIKTDIQEVDVKIFVKKIR